MSHSRTDIGNYQTKTNPNYFKIPFLPMCWTSRTSQTPHPLMQGFTNCGSQPDLQSWVGPSHLPLCPVDSKELSGHNWRTHQASTRRHSHLWFTSEFVKVTSDCFHELSEACTALEKEMDHSTFCYRTGGSWQEGGV